MSKFSTNFSSKFKRAKINNLRTFISSNFLGISNTLLDNLNQKNRL